MADLSFDAALMNSDDEPFLFVVAGGDGQEQTTTLHRHSRGQLLGATRGVLTVGVEDAVWIVPAMHAAWLPPHHPHWTRSHGPFEGWMLCIGESACSDLSPAPCTLRTSGLLREALLRAAGWPLAPLDEAAMRIAQLIVDELKSLPAQTLRLPMPRDKRLVRIAHGLVDDPASDRDLAAWAQWAGASARTVTRRFVAETGMTFTAWRQMARMLRSLQMLADGASVTTAALDLGYSTPSAFVALFGKTFGETPAAYQRRLDGGGRSGSL